MNFGEYKVLDGPRGTRISLVYTAVCNGSKFAIKVAKSPEYYPALLDNARVQIALDHPNIVKVLDWKFDEKGAPFVVMEHVDRPTLEELILSEKIITFGQKLFILDGMVQAIKYAHLRRKIHGDIGRRNIFADIDFVKLTDFSFNPEPLSLDSMELESVFANASYPAPEQAANPHPSEKADVYALTLCAWELVNERLAPKILMSIMPNKKCLPKDSLSALFEQGLAVSPEKRPDIIQLEKLLELVKREYNFILSSSDYSLFRKEPELIDFAAMHSGHESDILFKRASEMFPDNDFIIKRLAQKKMYSGDLEGAYRLLKGTNLRDNQRALLGIALASKSPERLRLLWEFCLEDACEVPVALGSQNYRLVKKKIRSNNVAVAAAQNNDARCAIGILKECIASEGESPAFCNNLGAAYAIANDRENGLKYLGKSNTWQACINRGLLYVQALEFGNALVAINQEEMESPKAAAIARLAAGMEIPQPLLVSQMAQRFSRGEIFPFDYEFIIT